MQYASASPAPAVTQLSAWHVPVVQLPVAGHAEPSPHVITFAHSVPVGHAVPIFPFPFDRQTVTLLPVPSSVAGAQSWPSEQSESDVHWRRHALPTQVSPVSLQSDGWHSPSHTGADPASARTKPPGQKGAGFFLHPAEIPAQNSAASIARDILEVGCDTVYFYSKGCHDDTMRFRNFPVRIGWRLPNWPVGIALSAVIVAAGACSSSAHSTPPPAFVDNSTASPTPSPAYPAPPYGPTVGAVIPDFEFLGYQNPQATTGSLQHIRLADFYNPHGKDPSYSPAAGIPDDRNFPEGSAYAGKLKPTVLLVDMASVWCVPCNEEAKVDLPSKYALYAPCGGEFLLQLADGPQAGVPATPQNLAAWTEQYSVGYPGAIDPEYQLQPLFQQWAYPQNIIIDTTTMKIVSVLAGEAVGMTCGANGGTCTTDAECQVCSGTCSDGSALCQSNADCTAPVTCVLTCGDNTTSCQTSAGCSAVTCATIPFWTTYESLLDRTRTGCTVK